VGFAGVRLLAVADGMGGHVAGGLAAQLAIDALVPLDTDGSAAHPADQLRAAIRTASSRIADRVRAEPALADMGTTVTAILFAGSIFGLAYVGDTRAYLLREGEFTRLSHDESLVQTLVDSGAITEEQAVNHPQRSVILRAVSAEPTEPALITLAACPGDRFLLCSDGLTDVVDDATLSAALCRDTPEAVADQLVERALRAGGPDNVTVIVADLQPVAGRE
jgi:protein phosphatase